MCLASHRGAGKRSHEPITYKTQWNKKSCRNTVSAVWKERDITTESDEDDDVDVIYQVARIIEVGWKKSLWLCRQSCVEKFVHWTESSMMITRHHFPRHNEEFLVRAIPFNILFNLAARLHTVSFGWCSASRLLLHMIPIIQTKLNYKSWYGSFFLFFSFCVSVKDEYKKCEGSWLWRWFSGVRRVKVFSRKSRCLSS